MTPSATTHRPPSRPRPSGRSAGGRPIPAALFSLFSPLAPLAGLCLLLGGCAVQPMQPAMAPPDAQAISAAGEAAPQPRPCPAAAPVGARCLGGQDRYGAHYLIVQPAQWSGVLVLHAHGGPTLGPPTVKRIDEDFERWAVVVKLGHAWAGSSFRQGGVAVRAAAEDTERLRRIAVGQGLQPRVTLLHGQSWGAGVAAVGAELMATAANGRSPYDGVLLTSGVLGGGSQSYNFRLDLRVVYQQLCNNHPLPTEPAYPLWLGLPDGSPLTRAQLASRAEACLGLKAGAGQRSAAQQARLDTLLNMVRVPEASVLAHLNWATWHFQDIAQRTGQSPFGNIGVRYTGSADDEAFNRSVARIAANPAAAARFAADTDPGGRIPVPVLTLHAVDDPTAFVELESTFRDTLQRGGSAGRLVQVFTQDAVHSDLGDSAYATVINALLQWLASGQRPTPAGVAAACAVQDARFSAGCRFLPDYQPPPLAARVPAR